jgi:hypothetical protein
LKKREGNYLAMAEPHSTPERGTQTAWSARNQLVDVLEEFLHYKNRYSSRVFRSPVYNDRWEVVALHHSGVWIPNAAGQPWQLTVKCGEKIWVNIESSGWQTKVYALAGSSLTCADKDEPNAAAAF